MHSNYPGIRILRFLPVGSKQIQGCKPRTPPFCTLNCQVRPAFLLVPRLQGEGSLAVYVRDGGTSRDCGLRPGVPHPGLCTHPYPAPQPGPWLPHQMTSVCCSETHWQFYFGHKSFLLPPRPASVPNAEATVWGWGWDTGCPVIAVSYFRGHIPKSLPQKSATNPEGRMLLYLLQNTIDAQPTASN